MSGGTTSPNLEEPRQGHLCCGCCCSMRTAVIIVNALGLASLLYSLVSMYSDPVGLTAEQEELLQEAEQISLIITIVGAVFFLIGIAGAVTYNVYLLGANIVYLLVSLFVDGYFSIKLLRDALEVTDVGEEAEVEDFLTTVLVGTVVVAVVGTLLCVYPHVGLIAEVRNGIASPVDNGVSPTIPSAEVKPSAKQPFVGAVYGGDVSKGTVKGEEGLEESC